MPYKSQAQKAKFKQMEKEGKIKSSTVREFDDASKGLKLPKKVSVEKATPPAKKNISSTDQIRAVYKKKYGQPS